MAGKYQGAAQHIWFLHNFVLYIAYAAWWFDLYAVINLQQKTQQVAKTKLQTGGGWEKKFSDVKP